MEALFFSTLFWATLIGFIPLFALWSFRLIRKNFPKSFDIPQHEMWNTTLYLLISICIGIIGALLTYYIFVLIMWVKADS